MTARVETVQVEDSLEAILAFYEERQWTDGLPIVPPTRTRVDAFVRASGRDPEEVLGTIPPANGEATVEHIAVNCVMAGCLPAYMPVVLAAVEAMLDPAFNLAAIQATTNPVAPLAIVNGPVRNELDFNSSYGAFGPGRRANATVGRAIRLVLINLGGAIPGVRDMAVAGHPGKYSFCVAENEDESPWPPLHVSLGFDVDQSVITMVGISSVINTLGGTVAQLSEAATFAGSNDYRFGGCPAFALNPFHVDNLAREGMTRETLQQALFASTKKRVGDFSPALLAPRVDDLGRAYLEDPANDVPIAKRPEDVVIFTCGAGGAGGHSLVLPSFGNTVPVSRAIASPSSSPRG